jgi:lipopolysaccharide/colanic/teichoic acid biosynthesis glycosyltransferase
MDRSEFEPRGETDEARPLVRHLVAAPKLFREMPPVPTRMARPITGAGAVAKRTLDVIVASTALLLLLPLLAVIALAVYLESPGPALFRQRRTGLGGATFEILKLRSMYHHAADPGGGHQTSRHDARVTRVGRFIRASSIDELPQLLNVIRGDMSLVGPRPHALDTRVLGERLDVLLPAYVQRHCVRPGLTGLAQVSGYRGALDSLEKLQNRLRLDLEYIETWSFGLDVKILLLTAVTVFSDRNAY